MGLKRSCSDPPCFCYWTFTASLVQSCRVLTRAVCDNAASPTSGHCRTAVYTHKEVNLETCPKPPKSYEGPRGTLLTQSVSEPWPEALLGIRWSEAARLKEKTPSHCPGASGVGASAFPAGMKTNITWQSQWHTHRDHRSQSRWGIFSSGLKLLVRAKKKTKPGSIRCPK